jgi:hypothetical protein
MKLNSIGYLWLIVIERIDIVLGVLKESASPHHIVLKTSWGYFFKVNNLISHRALLLLAVFSELF